MHKKGQTATEYLIILAVVIIIALIVVGVMGGIPGLGGGAKSKTSQAYWSTSDIAFTSYSTSPTGLTLNIRNNKLNSITLNSITLGGTPLSTTPSLPLTLSTGQTIQLISGSKNCTTGSYSYTLDINYTDVTLNKNFIFNGDGQTLDGACAS